jgi:hypothetical protein
MLCATLRKKSSMYCSEAGSYCLEESSSARDSLFQCK